MQIIVPNLSRYFLPSKAEDAVKEDLTCDAPTGVRFHATASSFLKRNVVSVVLFVFVALGFWILGDYGVPGDTDDQRDLPLRLIDYLLGRDDRFLHPIDRFLGVTFEFPLYLSERALGLHDSRDIHLMRHMVTHLFFLTGGFFCYLLVYRMFNNRLLAVIALLLFLLHPRIYAHSFFNSKDAPFLSMFMICLYLTHWAFGKGNVWRFLILGVAVGVLINLRVMGITLFLPIAVMRMMDCISEREDRRRVVLTVAVFVVSTLLTVYVSQPYLWTDPIAHFIEWLEIAAAHPDRLAQLFRGELILSKNINPLEYVPVWISITTPPAVIVMSVVGILVILSRGLIAPHGVFKNTQLRFCLLIMACLMSPIAVAAFLDANLFNGWRHLYFLYVPLCLLAVIAVDWITSIPFLWLKILTHGAIGVGIAASIVSMASIHPHEYIYFNFLVDRTTPDRLRSQYEMDYLFMSHLEGFNMLLGRYPSASLHVQLSNREVNDLSWEILTEADRRRMIREREYSDSYIVNYYTFRPYGTEMQHVTAPLIYRRVIYNNKLIDVVVSDLHRVDDAVAARYEDIYEVAVSSKPVERSLWDIYVDGYTLIYINEECVADDYIRAFFLHLSPDDIDDLPDHRRRDGHVTRNFDFEFERHGVRFDGKCMAIVQLPYDDISGVRTGQFTSNGELWSVAINMRLGQEDAYHKEYESVMPDDLIINSDFDVYLRDGRLVYINEECAHPYTDAEFFLEIVPSDPEVLPPIRRRSKLDSLGFVFATRGVMLDGVCIASVGLPDYEIEGIRTGQHDAKDMVIWEEEYSFAAAELLGLVEELRGRGIDPVVRSEFDVYLDDGRLIYFKSSCTAGDADTPFFLHVYPVDVGDLSKDRRLLGFGSFSFSLRLHGMVHGEDCFGSFDLPDYDTAGFLTGQFVRGGENEWEVGYSLVTAELPSVVERLRGSSVAPVIRSYFDVYLDENRLIYIRESCADSDMDAKFFLHIYPVDVDDIPTERKESGFDNLGFVFETHGLMFDGMCVASIGLPNYDIKRIRTGQWEPEQQRDIWKEEFDVR